MGNPGFLIMAKKEREAKEKSKGWKGIKDLKIFKGIISIFDKFWIWLSALGFIYIVIWFFESFSKAERNLIAIKNLLENRKAFVFYVLFLSISVFYVLAVYCLYRIIVFLSEVELG